MKICIDPDEMQSLALSIRAQGKKIGFVPTMGFLHEGHASLIRIARSQCDFLVVSIFVNPLQFGENEDLDTYPKDDEADERLCLKEDVDLIFRPQSLYDTNHNTYIHVEQLTERLCGASRPTHFRGVCTVVARLFGLVQPTLAVFGEKDYQQLAVIRQFVRDLAMPIEIIGAPLIRDEDGVALSSRNQYLDPAQRIQARTISQALFSVQEELKKTSLDVHTIRQLVRQTLDVDELDYLECIDPVLLHPVTNIDKPTRLLIAAWVGQTRLIDNVLLEP